ncbi:MAG: hypothetical protein ACPHID_01880 [Thermoplasmatota archaeon]
MKRIILATLTLALIPAVSAQIPASDFDLAAAVDEVYLDPAGTTSIDVEVTLGCALILQGLEQSSISVDATLPSWISTTPATIAVSLADCAGDEDLIITKTGSVGLTPSADAPGLEPFNVDLQASFNDASGTATTAEATIEGLAVDYVPGHTMTPNGDQTFQVENGSYSFTLDLDIAANARTMVMFEDRVVSGGTLNGLTHKIFEVPTGETSTTYTVTWTAPEGEWTEETVTFYTYSHCLDREGCDPTNEANPVWTFVNANPGVSAPRGEGDAAKGIPGPGSFLLMLVLVATALLMRRA